MIWKSAAPPLQIPLIENNFDEVGLVLISSHLIEILHCLFSSYENEDAAASSFCFDFVATAWVHKYLPGAGSIIGTQSTKNT